MPRVYTKTTQPWYISAMTDWAERVEIWHAFRYWPVANYELHESADGMNSYVRAAT